MHSSYHALRTLKNDKSFGKGDVLVLFGELFNRGYGTGLVEEAERRGMTIIRSTVGRRDSQGQLRALNDEELAQIPKPVINIPLEAGFDLEPDSQGRTLVDTLKDIKLSEWQNAKLDKSAIHEWQKRGHERFQKHTRSFVKELNQILPSGKNIMFAHLMAGGVPRAKIVMPLMNRSVKGSGDRYLSSEQLWSASLGQLLQICFQEVTAETFAVLVHETEEIRHKWEASGAKVRYSAYGYHGTETLVGPNYVWQTYSPYLQGWAKIKLENYARDFTAKGIHCCVYNCPEILTNSSAIFSGVEVSLYPLMAALRKDAHDHAKVDAVLKECQSLLKDPNTIEDVISYSQKYLSSDLIRGHCEFDQWPTHSSQPQLEKMLETSDFLLEMHKDHKQVITSVLSEIVIIACGQVMLADIPHPEAPVAWINHDIIAKTL